MSELPVPSNMWSFTAPWSQKVDIVEELAGLGISGTFRRMVGDRSWRCEPIQSERWGETDPWLRKY